MKLRALLDAIEANQRLMVAEASRQLGDFATAASLLDFVFAPDYTEAAQQIQNLTRDNDVTVRELVPREIKLDFLFKKPGRRRG